MTIKNWKETKTIEVRGLKKWIHNNKKNFIVVTQERGYLQRPSWGIDRISLFHGGTDYRIGRAPTLSGAIQIAKKWMKNHPSGFEND